MVGLTRRLMAARIVDPNPNPDAQADVMRTALVAALAEPVPAGSPSVLEGKRLAYLSAAIMEMPSATVREDLVVPLLAELEALFPHSSRQVRAERKPCLSRAELRS